MAHRGWSKALRCCCMYGDSGKVPTYDSPLLGLHVLVRARSSMEQVSTAMANWAVAEGLFWYPGLPIQNLPETRSKIRLRFLFRKRRL